MGCSHLGGCFSPGKSNKTVRCFWLLWCKWMLVDLREQGAEPILHQMRGGGGSGGCVCWGFSCRSQAAAEPPWRWDVHSQDVTLISQLISLSAVGRGSAQMTSPSPRRSKRRSNSEMSHLLPHLPVGDGDIIVCAGDGCRHTKTLPTIVQRIIEPVPKCVSSKNVYI